MAKKTASKKAAPKKAAPKKAAPKKRTTAEQEAHERGNTLLEHLAAGVTPEPQPVGYLTTGLDLVAAITELEREATIAQYRLLQRAMGKTQGLPIRAGIFAPITQEVDAYLALYRRDGGRDDYGHTYDRSRTSWYAIGWTDHPTEGMEVVARPIDPSASSIYGKLKVPGPDATDIPAGFKVKPVQEFPTIMVSVNRWIADYIAEVDACCKRYQDGEGNPHEDLGGELDRLRTTLEAFQWGNGTQELLKATQAASAIAQDMKHGQVKLLAKLKEVRDDYAPAENSTAVTLTWNAGAQELAALMNLLVKHGLLVAGKSMAALAKQWQATFRKADGSTMDLVQAVRNTKRRNAGRIIDLEDDIPKKGKTK